MATREKAKIRRRESPRSEDNEKSASRKKRLTKAFGSKKFGIEHALSLRSRDYILMPAKALYEKELLRPYTARIEKCHIYLVGTLPEIELVDSKISGRSITARYEALGDRFDLQLPPIPEGVTEVSSENCGWVLIDAKGKTARVTKEQILHQLRAHGMPYNFEVLYIGQAFGKNGSRHAVHRLLNHEKLQMIAIHGAPKGHELMLCLVEVEPTTTLMTVINPFAKNQKKSDERIDNGIDILRHTTEAQRTSIFEAALVRHFQPEYNKQLKDSFPSTNNSQLKACYKKDIAAVSAELNLMTAPFGVFSSTISPEGLHLACYDLHDDEARKVFFMKS